MAVRRGRKAKRKKGGRQIAQEEQGQEKEQEQAGQEQAGQELEQLEQLEWSWLLLAMKEVHSWGTDEGATQQIPKISCFPQRDFSYIN